MNPITPPKMPPLPARIAKLPKNARGYPVPWFVAWVDGVPDFRFVTSGRVRDAYRRRLCWICGEPLGRQGTFVVGPMCVVNRTSAEPPSHRDCAEFAVRACPFILNPGMTRREDEMTKTYEPNVAGVMIKRNPGVMAVWSTKKWHSFNDDKGGMLLNIGDCSHVSWWREGRTAMRAEIEESINSGIPLLIEACHSEEADLTDLKKRTVQALRLVRETSKP